MPSVAPDLEDPPARHRVVLGRQPERMPAIPQQRRPAYGLGAVAAHPDRDGRWGVDDREPVRRAPHCAHPLLRAHGPVVVVRAENLELSAQIANSHAEDQSIAREATQRPRHGRHHQRVTVRGNQDIGTEAQSARGTESPRTRRQRFEERWRKVHRRRVIGNRHVIREPCRVEAQLLTCGDELGDCCTVGTCAVRRNREAEFHAK